MSKSKIIKTLKLRCWPLAFTSYKVKKKTQRFGTSLPASYFAWLLKKNISHVIFSQLTKCNWLHLLLEALDNICFVLICFPVDDVIKFEINVFLHNLKIQVKNLKNHFYYFFLKHFPLKQIQPTFFGRCILGFNISHV